jgi:hypothetical protein
MRKNCAIKWYLIISFLIFLWLSLKLLKLVQDLDLNDEHQTIYKKSMHLWKNESIPVINNRQFIESLLTNELIKRNKINSLNETNETSSSQTKNVYNAPKFLVILVQVHSRLNYLRELIDSLRQTKYIEETLVIFSHDIYDEEMNSLINNIDFCSTLQIFYPYSMQLYPNKFPGDDPNDCNNSLKKDEALKEKCNTAAHPDTFGNYRAAKVVQIKHHWIWKLSYVFEMFNETKNIDNLHVLLLEEDYYLMPDSIHVLRKLSEK